MPFEMIRLVTNPAVGARTILVMLLRYLLNLYIFLLSLGIF